MLKEVLEYFSNLDLDGVNDADMLQKPLEEIKGYETQVILNKETCMKLEIILSRCSLKQLMDIYKRMNIEELVLTKMGSQMLEKVYKLFFPHAYVSTTDDAVAEEVLETAFTSLDPHVEMLALHPYGTFVLRPYFELLSGIVTNYKSKSRDWEEPGRYRKGKVKTNRIKKHERFCRKLRSYSDYFMGVLDEIFSEAYASATFSVYLQCSRHKSLIRMVIDKYCSRENLNSPIFSYFFEDLVSFVSRKHIDAFFLKIKDHIAELGLSENSNYVIRRLTERCAPKMLYRYLSDSLERYPKNSNIVLSLLFSLYDAHENTEFLELVANFYGPDNLFQNILISNGKIVYKYVKLIGLVMSLKESKCERKNVVKQINLDFLSLFDPSWLYEKAGRELVQGFVTGSALPRQKRQFISRIEKEYGKLASNYYGKKLLVTVSRYADNDRRLKIISILKKSQIFTNKVHNTPVQNS